MSVTALSAATRLNADLFAAASQHTESGHGKLTVAIDDCGTVVPHKIHGWPPPPPPPLSQVSQLGHYAGVDLPTPTNVADDWCGTVPHKFPFPPPPPPPWIEGANQLLTR